MSDEILEIGSIRITRLAQWQIQALEALIFATRDQGVGILQITTKFRDEINPQQDHSHIQKLAFEFAGIADASKVDTIDTKEEGGVKSARFSLERGGTVDVYWYKLTPQGLILAAYKAEKSEGEKEQIRNEIEECDLLVGSVQFAD